MPPRAIVLLLICLLPVSAADEPKKDPNDAGRGFRKMFLTMTAEQAGIQRSREFPRVWGVAVDWPIGKEVATIISLADGSASVYTTSTFGVIGGIGHETVRTAAKKLVKEADLYYDASSATQDLSYPALDHVRFFFVTFDGVRVIDTDLDSVAQRRSKYSPLFGLAQDVLTELRLTTNTK
jgi:hypothetical protein